MENDDWKTDPEWAEVRNLIEDIKTTLSRIPWDGDLPEEENDEEALHI